MKVAIVGGTGLVGSRLATELRRRGAEVLVVSRSANIDVLESPGLNRALVGVDVVVDVLNTSALDSAGATDFFQRAAINIARAEREDHIPHHVLLSIIGLELASRNGHYVGKLAQEQVVKDSGVPFTIVRATQFFEFLPTIAEFFAFEGEIRLPRTLVQPLAVNDVVNALANAAESAPLNGTVEIAGPDKLPIVDAIRLVLERDSRSVVEVSGAEAFGVDTRDALIPSGPFIRGEQRLMEWMAGRDAPFGDGVSRTEDE